MSIRSFQRLGFAVAALPHSLKRLTRWSSPVWHTVTYLPDEVRDSALHRQAQLLNYLLIPIFAALAFLSNWSGTPSGYAIYFCVNLVSIVVAYVLNRSGRYWPAASIVCVLLLASAFATFFIKVIYRVPSPEISLMRVMPAIIIAYLLLTLRGMLAISISSIIPMIFIALIAPSAYPLLFTTFYFTFITSALMTIAGISRRRYATQIERQAHELAESEERFRSLLEASFETIIVHKDSIILDVNPAVETLIGYKPDEVIGKSALDFVEPPYHKLMLANYTNGSTEPYEVVLRHKNGAALHAEMRGKTQRYRGELVRVVAVRDITELKHQQELTVEREKVRVLQKFIGNLSHDLRTPLSVINTSIYLIDRLEKEPERQHHQIDVLQAQAVHMQRLLEELITMSRLDKADTSDFRFRWVNINEPVTQALRDHQNLALRKQQVLASELGSGLPDVLLDVDQFKLAMKHLILNGLSYTPEGGTVTVETSTDGANAIVQVRDTGIGIATSDIPHIFEHFYRADPARGKDGGTGVGLTIAKKIVEAHGGTINVASQSGQGSVFTILLPIPPR